ncbi:outer surface protein ErpG (plasmid) [Borreliella burgdorferi]|uniref:outer surface protein ErpG n=1 Tax=Borreliella burgdorferi TaxID=139 RepID=UPI001AEF90A9|nr:outer surface protein ErpG [Borreliella burgdorferi]QXG44657.1 outer surface protein ErpG [Borreliella burgdorferi]
MNKIMKNLIICAVFAMISSCKNYASGEDIKQNVKEKVEGFLEAKKEELVGGLKKLGSEAYLKVEELMQADRPQVQAEEQVAQGVFEDPELKEKGLEEKIEELKELKDSSKKTKEDRKKELEEAKQKLEEFKEQVESATGESTEKVKKQGNIGQKALKYAKELGVNGSYSVNDGTNTNDFVKKVIDDALKNIEEELEKLAEPQNIEDKK